MSYLFNEFEDKDRIPYLESEITRLQDMCRNNFTLIDDLKKQNRKLADVQTELKETTTDLAYSLAECPWWEEETIKESVKVLASFTQKIQYILELPTFLDPFEQLERNGIHDIEKVKQYLRRQRKRMKKLICFKCLKCRRSFRLKSNFKTHMSIHKKVKKLKCRICPSANERFATFPLLKFHLKKMHSNASNSKIAANLLASDSETSSQKKEFSFNHLKISKFVKCPKCEGTFRSIQAYNRHQNFCRFPHISESFIHAKGKSEIPVNHRRISNSKLKSVSSGNSSDVIILDLSEVEVEKEVITLEDETSKSKDFKYEYFTSIDFEGKNGITLSQPNPFMTSTLILDNKNKMKKIDYKLEDFDVNHLMKRGLTMACSSCKESFNSNQDLINHMKTHIK